MHEVLDTPFAVIRIEKEWKVGMGLYVIAKGLKSKKEAVEWATSITWNKILLVMEVLHREKEEAFENARRMKELQEAGYKQATTDENGNLMIAGDNNPSEEKTGMEQFTNTITK